MKTTPREQLPGKVGALMRLRKLPWLRRYAAVVCGAVGLVIACGVASAAPKDGAADKAYKAALEEDYLDSKFDDAQKKLDKAIGDCGESGCSPKVKAKLLVGKGIVMGGGKHKLDEAKEAFTQALKLDSTATPDADYMTSDLKSAFEEAQKAAKKSGGSGGSGASGGSGGSVEPSGGPLTHTPPEEQKINSPIPIYVTLDEDTAKKVGSVTVTYVGVGGGEPKDMRLDKSGKSYRGTIPCSATAK
jgi:hypothetical protein